MYAESISSCSNQGSAICVCCLFWINRNSIAVTSFCLYHYPIRVMNSQSTLSVNGNIYFYWNYGVLRKLIFTSTETMVFWGNWYFKQSWVPWLVYIYFYLLTNFLKASSRLHQIRTSQRFPTPLQALVILFVLYSVT